MHRTLSDNKIVPDNSIEDVAAKNWEFPMKTQSANASGDQSNMNTGREWSDPELLELGDLLMYEISIKEIARLLERDHGDVQAKVVEIGRACR